MLSPSTGGERTLPSTSSNQTSQDSSPYYPRDFDDIPTEYREGSARYASWKDSKSSIQRMQNYSFTSFGERDAIECHRHMGGK